jgi:hypothetical protein
MGALVLGGFFDSRGRSSYNMKIGTTRKVIDKYVALKGKPEMYF